MEEQEGTVIPIILPSIKDMKIANFINFVIKSRASEKPELVE